MNFFTILHGKPNAGCHKATDGMEETFCNNIVDKFFQLMSNIKDNEVLIVDTRYWKDTWYSIYTFWVGGNILDTTNRGSFLAISIVVPNQYFCLVSAVYEMLAKTYQEYVISTYLSKDGKYIVSDFNNNSAFDKLVSVINSYFVNLSENFDASFKQTLESTPSKYYNLFDCDSKAFVEDLKKCGRIFVGKSYESKDTRLNNTDKCLKELQKTKIELNLSQSKINSLTKRIKELETLLNNKANENSDTIAILKEEIKKLIKEKSNLEKRLSELINKTSEYEKIIKQIAQLIGVKPSTHEPIPTPKEDLEHKIDIKNSLPIVNTILLMILFLLNGLKSCDSQTQELTSETDKNTCEELQNQMNDLQAIMAEGNGEIKSLQSSIDEYNPDDSNLNTDAIVNKQDVDCGLTCYQNNIPVEPNNIDINKPLTIIVKKEMAGYDFHVDNIKAAIKSGEAFDLNKIDKNKPIIIKYRSENKSNCNKSNTLIIN
ncbi:MAG: hypothetical protein Q4A15_02430 [Prevotellaceae bacterium]|nr:hypothetical protein [Prevotellaceae bacterium]